MADAGPYRGFVEHAPDVFEALRQIGVGILEQAVKNALPPMPQRVLARFEGTTSVRLLDCIVRARYGLVADPRGWTDIEITRAAHCEDLWIRFTPSCGHRARITLDERLIYLCANHDWARNTLFDSLDAKSRERNCYCVPMETP